MKIYTFNRNDLKWAEDYYALIQKTMHLPEWFGKNADALLDMLTGYIETPCQIELIGFNKKENKYNEQVINKINSCFKDAEKEFPKLFKVIEKY